MFTHIVYSLLTHNVYSLFTHNCLLTLSVYSLFTNIVYSLFTHNCLLTLSTHCLLIIVYSLFTRSYLHCLLTWSTHCLFTLFTSIVYSHCLLSNFAVVGPSSCDKFPENLWHKSLSWFAYFPQMLEDHFLRLWFHYVRSEAPLMRLSLEVVLYKFGF